MPEQDLRVLHCEAWVSANVSPQHDGGHEERLELLGDLATGLPEDVLANALRSIQPTWTEPASARLNAVVDRAFVGAPGASSGPAFSDRSRWRRSRWVYR